jgi:SAM-dependent methyltransferase
VSDRFMSGSKHRPIIVDEHAHREFEEKLRQCGYDPDNRWLGDYVNISWQTLRPILRELPSGSDRGNVLEFGCNIGAGAITAALLGMRVTAIDVDSHLVEVARLNARRYGVADRIDFRHVDDTRALPFLSGTFDLVICCSVLEYVQSDRLRSVLVELDRVTAQGGIVLITATSNRLAPREVHSGDWFGNYLPRCIDDFLGRQLCRGVFPWTVRRALGRSYVNLDYEDCGRSLMRARVAVGMSQPRLMILRSLNVLCHALGFSVGMLLPSLSMTLKKR